MKTQKYSVNQHLINNILSAVQSDEIAIPEIQRPFVWDATKVRNLMDSLYQGYPIGYLIAWRNPNVRLKDGTTSAGKKILIDGQQRVTALTAALLGNSVINKDYRKARIKISFHPIEQKFEVLNTAILKDSMWIPDISELFQPGFSFIKLVNEYVGKNQGLESDLVFHRLEALKNIVNKQIGMIELDPDLDIETVTEIFIRINSEGVVLSQADFVMSKIASNEVYGGNLLRKCIDYFCHMAITPDFFNHIKEVDNEFTKTPFFPKISWLKDEMDDLFDPSYTDLLRVAFTSEFNRGKLSDLVALLSGRNFETRTYEEEIAKNSFATLEKGVLNFINENNFKKFIMIIRSAGFITPSLIRSQNTLNFAYIVYLKLRELNYNPAEIEKYVKRWFVFSILNGRYSGSAESNIDNDIKQIATHGIETYLASVEAAELSDGFWNVALVQNLETSATFSPYFNLFCASQVKFNDKGFLSKDITVKNLIELMGDVHHIFPKEYLKKLGHKRSSYNQIANYVYMQSEINIKIGYKSPRVYLNEILEQVNGGKLRYGGIDSKDMLKENMKANCIPESVFELEGDKYEEFLLQRRELIAEKIKNYYKSL